MSTIQQGRILIIDSDSVSRAEIASVLVEAQFVVVDVPDFREALRSMHDTSAGIPDLVIVAGEEAVAREEQPWVLLRHVSRVPIIVLGAKEVPREAETLEAGADAYMSKPPDPRELVARVRSLVRRWKGRRCDPACGDEGCDPWGSTADYGNGRAHLTPTECRLLSYLLLSEDRLVPYAELICTVWGGKQVGRDCLNFYMRRLKNKLSSALPAQGQIVNHRAVGYRLCRNG